MGGAQPPVAGLRALSEAVLADTGSDELVAALVGAARDLLGVDGFVRMRRVTRDDLQTLEAMADLATVACQNAEAFQRVESAMRLDSLTGLLDHAALQGRLREEIARARQSRHPLACVIVNLDDFETINERAGHARGDDVLARAAAVMHRSVRPYDVLARYGGDEFALVLPSCDKGEAGLRAEVVLSALAEHVALPADAGRLTASIGVAMFNGGEDAEALLDRALNAARQASRAGGGRVVVA